MTTAPTSPRPSSGRSFRHGHRGADRHAGEGAGRRHRHLRRSGPVPDRWHAAARPRLRGQLHLPAPVAHRREGR
ncbi:hypothetical protein G6F52_014137 [Rhizopus delemar]|nr:hypothetical protein G6F52_014137 [Rhizopus delemar]